MWPKMNVIGYKKIIDTTSKLEEPLPEPGFKSTKQTLSHFFILTPKTMSNALNWDLHQVFIPLFIQSNRLIPIKYCQTWTGCVSLYSQSKTVLFCSQVSEEVIMMTQTLAYKMHRCHLMWTQNKWEIYVCSEAESWDYGTADWCRVRPFRTWSDYCAFLL